MLPPHHLPTTQQKNLTRFGKESSSSGGNGGSGSGGDEHESLWEPRIVRQKARVRKRERLLSAKRRDKDSSGSSITRGGRPSTPSMLTRFKQPDHGSSKRPRTAGPAGDSGGTRDTRGHRGRGQQQRPQSSPTRRNISNTLSMPALHAVTSPQRPFYPAQDHAIARIMQHVGGSSSGSSGGGRRRGRNRPSTALSSSSSTCRFLTSVSQPILLFGCMLIMI